MSMAKEARKRAGRDHPRRLAIGGGLLLAVVVLILAGRAIMSRSPEGGGWSLPSVPGGRSLLGFEPSARAKVKAWLAENEADPDYEIIGWWGPGEQTYHYLVSDSGAISSNFEPVTRVMVHVRYRKQGPFGWAIKHERFEIRDGTPIRHQYTPWPKEE